MSALTVGGKAHALAELADAGERVPAWRVLPADLLEAHLERAGMMDAARRELSAIASVRDDDRAARAAIAGASDRLTAMVDGLAIDGSLASTLDRFVGELGGPFAVRSSAVGEDGARLSFAGQYDTLLGVTADELADAVRRCWRSAFGPRVLDYRRRHDVLDDATRLAVIVQRLVPAEVAGVLFTVDPLTGDATRIRVSACAGLGEGVVSGSADADEYLLARDGTLLGCTQAREGTRLLDDATLRALAETGRRVAERAGGARDVEWAVQGGVVWVLQSRPVTGLVARAGPPAPETANRIVWDNSNIQESYCGVTTPLTFSFASAAYAEVYEQTMRALGIDERTIDAHRPMLRTLLGLLRGRVYYNLNGWYRGLLLLPSFGRNKADMERMMGVEEPVDFVEDEAPGLRSRLGRVPRLARTLLRLLRAFTTLERDTARFLSDLERRLRAIDRERVAERSLGDLMLALDRLRECLLRWTTPIVNDFFVMMATGRLRRLVSRALPLETDRAMQALLGAADVEASAGAATGLLELAGIVRADAALARRIIEDAPADADATLGELRRASPPFSAALDALMARFGDRCMGELKLESRPLRDDPAFIVRMLHNYLVSRPHDIAAMVARARAARDLAEHEVARCLGAWGRIRFRRALASARRGIRAREQMRLARTRLFGAHRDVYRAIGRRLHEAGQLDRPDDVLYLTTTEIRDLWEGTAACAALAPIARARRIEFASYEGESLPGRVITTGVPADALCALSHHATTGDGDGTDRGTSPGSTCSPRLLRGLGCSAGIVEGTVRIVRSPSDDLAIEGHVLVAERTDPGWAPLFPSASAIVIERGSMLSHSAVLARELGLPAVVGIAGIVVTLRDGERVRVDGAAGTVERLEA